MDTRKDARLPFFGLQTYARPYKCAFAVGGSQFVKRQIVCWRAVSSCQSRPSQFPEYEASMCSILYSFVYFFGGLGLDSNREGCLDLKTLHLGPIHCPRASFLRGRDVTRQELRSLRHVQHFQGWRGGLPSAGVLLKADSSPDVSSFSPQV